MLFYHVINSNGEFLKKLLLRKHGCWKNSSYSFSCLRQRKIGEKIKKKIGETWLANRSQKGSYHIIFSEMQNHHPIPRIHFPPPPIPHTHAHTHAHTHVHIPHIHKYIHTRTYAHTHAYTHAHTHTRVRAHAHFIDLVGFGSVWVGLGGFGSLWVGLYFSITLVPDDIQET